MKYVVFSFDDGLRDFKDNALPILNKYNMKASLNIISGFSDKTVVPHYDCLSIDDIRELHEQGFEIANHTNSHLKYGSYDEFLTCNNKLNKWLNEDKIYGVVMPKYAKPNDSATEYIKKYKPPYISYESQKKNLSKNFIRRFLWKLIYVIKKDELSLYSYDIQIKMYKKNTKENIRRIEVGQKVNPEILAKALKHIKNNHYLTIVFHSITNKPDDCSYPRGAWTINQFSSFCNSISTSNEVKVVRQLDAFS